MSIRDIVAYQNPRVYDLFEHFERQVDISHHVSLSKDFIRALYEKHDLSITWTLEWTVELDVREYLNHAVQLEGGAAEIERPLEIGLRDREIRGYLVAKGRALSFRGMVS